MYYLSARTYDPVGKVDPSGKAQQYFHAGPHRQWNPPRSTDIRRCSTNERSSMRRALVISVACVLLLAVAPLALRSASRWDGVRSHREFSPGEEVRLQSGITLTVPEGRTASLTKYFAVPVWLPLGQSGPDGLRFSEYFAMRKVSNPSQDADELTVISYYDESMAPETGEISAQTDTVQFTRVGIRGRRVVITVPGARPGYVFCPGGGVFMVGSILRRPTLEEVWALAKVRGATLPR